MNVMNIVCIFILFLRWRFRCSVFLVEEIIQLVLLNNHISLCLQYLNIV